MLMSANGVAMCCHLRGFDGWGLHAYTRVPLDTGAFRNEVLGVASEYVTMLIGLGSLLLVVPILTVLVAQLARIKNGPALEWESRLGKLGGQAFFALAGAFTIAMALMFAYVELTAEHSPSPSLRAVSLIVWLGAYVLMVLSVRGTVSWITERSLARWRGEMSSEQ